MGQGGGGNATEGAVLRALRWLKDNQSDDGSWRMSEKENERFHTAMAGTSLALLVFLGHGETPKSPEFGAAIQKAIEYVCSQEKPNGHFDNVDSHEYAHSIAAMALAEAYGLTRSPTLKKSAQRAVRVIVEGQNADGGWTYNFNAYTRNDTCFMGWCAQALMAADMAGVFSGDEQTELRRVAMKSIKAFRSNYKIVNDDMGGFGYTSPGTRLTGVGVFATQILGDPGAEEVLKGLNWIAANRRVDWEEPEGRTYVWYYCTYAMFMAGGQHWKQWNQQLAPALVKNQVRIDKETSGYVDHHGRMQETGYWDCPAGGHGSGIRLLDTCLSALQLEVYYRYIRDWAVPERMEPVIRELVAKLDDESYSKREEATKELLRMRPCCLPLMRKYADASDDPEVKMRVKRVMEVLSGR